MRGMSLEHFIERWTLPDYPPTLVEEHALVKAEISLNAQFPAEYRSAVLRCGLPHPTAALLESIVENELSIADLNDFFDPIEMIEVNHDWRAMGLPAELVAFANDCMGNLFCFSAAATYVSPIFYFSHDEGSVDEVAASFTMWIKELADVPAI